MKKTLITALAIVLSPILSFALSMDDIAYWVGTGSKRAAMVVDFAGDGTDSAAFVWGFRFEGDEVTGLEMLQAVSSDPASGLTATFAYGGSFISYLSYGEHSMTVATIPHQYSINYYQGAATNATPVDWTFSEVGSGGRILTDNSWDGWVNGYLGDNWVNEGSDPSNNPQNAPVPFATEVVNYQSGSNCYFYTNATAALGRPEVTVNFYSEAAPVVPVYPPWQDTAENPQLVQIGAGGELVLKFDHQVTDDPNNLYGVDFIVFGNAMLSLSGSDWNYEDPTSVSVAGLGFEEPGIVSVSQDGTNWFTYTEGPHSDTMWPTLGRLYDPANWVDPNYPNWGADTDPTVPMDPTVDAASITNTVAELCRRYRGSAGGTGFDLSGLALPMDGQGRKWIQFVRVQLPEGASYPNTEVDAIADAAPAADYDLWRVQHYPWAGDPTNEAPEVVAEGAVLNNNAAFALGVAPESAEMETLQVVMGSAGPEISFLCNDAVDDDLLQVEVCTNLGDSPVWTTNGVDQVLRTEPAGEGRKKVIAGSQEVSGSFRLVIKNTP